MVAIGGSRPNVGGTVRIVSSNETISESFGLVKTALIEEFDWHYVANRQ